MTDRVRGGWYGRWRLPWGLIALNLVVLLAALGCSRGGTDDLIIRSDAEYNAVLSRAEELSKERLRAIDQGAVLSEQDLVAFQEALRLFEALSAYQPRKYTLYFGSGRIYQVLGQDEMAVMRFRQCVNNAPETEDPAVLSLLARSHLHLTQSYLVLRRYEEALESADAAVGLFPENPDFLAMRASALVQLERSDEAMVDIEKALKIEPSHSMANDLKKLIEFARQG